jgi:hypothetical protein
VQESAGVESPVLEEHQPDTPAGALDRLVTLTALGLARGRTLRTIDPRESPVPERVPCGPLQSFPFGDLRGCLRERLQDGLRPLVGRAPRVKPQGHLALAKWIGLALAEAQFAARDGPAAAATLRASARSSFDHVRHLHLSGIPVE